MPTHVARDEEEEPEDGVLESKSFSDSENEQGDNDGPAPTARDELAVDVTISWEATATAREDNNLSLIQYDASLGKGVFTKVKELSVLFSNISVGFWAAVRKTESKAAAVRETESKASAKGRLTEWERRKAEDRKDLTAFIQGDSSNLVAYLNRRAVDWWSWWWQEAEVETGNELFDHRMAYGGDCASFFEATTTDSFAPVRDGAGRYVVGGE